MKPSLLLALAAGCIPPALRAEAPRPVWNVLPGEIIQSRTIHQGGRNVTIQELQPIPLPPPPQPQAHPQHDSLLGERAEAFRNQFPRRHLLSLSATIYQAADTPPRTYVRIPGDATRGPVEFWSSKDFGLLSHTIGAVPGPEHEIFLLLIAGSIDMDRMENFANRGGRIYQRPEIPEFPEGGPAFLITSGSPVKEVLESIQSIHEHLETNRETLQAARITREAEARERRELLKANPPQARNLTLNYWRITPDGKGGAR